MILLLFGSCYILSQELVKLFNDVVVMSILYTPATSLKLMSVPEAFALCLVCPANVVLVCAIVVICGIYVYKILQFWDLIHTREASSFGSCPSIVACPYFILYALPSASLYSAYTIIFLGFFHYQCCFNINRTTVPVFSYS